MALKDWKKTINGFSTMVWANKKNKNEIWYSDDSDLENSKFRLRLKNMESNQYQKLGSINYFKTKSQALKFAKAYMRKH